MHLDLRSCRDPAEPARRAGDRGQRGDDPSAGQRTVRELLDAGRSTRAIANELGVSEARVRVERIARSHTADDRDVNADPPSFGISVDPTPYVGINRRPLADETADMIAVRAGTYQPPKHESK